jgi:subtilisin family serine protease
LVAGVAALVLSVNSGLTAAQVKDILEITADKIVDTDPDAILGTTKGTYSNGHCEWFGHGKVNAARAVAEAKRRKRG